jgi:hypothetical protein
MIYPEILHIKELITFKVEGNFYAIYMLYINKPFESMNYKLDILIFFEISDQNKIQFLNYKFQLIMLNLVDFM